MSEIITAEELNSYTGQTLNETRAQLVIDGVNNFIETRTGRVWGETKTATEVSDVRRSSYLRKMDVQSVTSVKIGRGASQVTLNADSYLVDASGRVNLYHPPLYLHQQHTLSALEITYVYGNVEVPADLKLAALALAADGYNRASQGEKDVKSESVGSYSVVYGSAAGAAGDRSPMSVVDSYRKRRS